MARMHGSVCKVYIGGRDASCDLATVNPKASAATHDATTFCSNGWEVADPGLCSWECSVEGFYDPAAAGIGRQFEDGAAGLLGNTGGIISIYDGSADAIGDTGILLSDGILTVHDRPISVNDLVKLKGDFKPAGGGARAGLFAKLLHVHAQDTGSADGASLNNGGSSANGGRANLHITAITGTWTIKVQHSANNTDWADLVTFSGKTAIGASTSEVAGTVNQYLRASSTEDVAGSCTFVLGFARY